jgi:hypothetical protein
MLQKMSKGSTLGKRELLDEGFTDFLGGRLRPHFYFGLPMNHAYKVLVVGVARNCEHTILGQINIIKKACAIFREVNFFVVESDSTDRTLERLRQMETTSSNFSFVSLGALSTQIPARTDRIAFCRNRYLDEIQSNKSLGDCDYVIVADLDGVNDLINKERLQSCWSSGVEWDACFANQSGPYYDIWALRHQDWCPNDCWQNCEALKKVMDSENALRVAVQSKMITISDRNPWIEVESAFGGFGVYRRSAFGLSNYVGHDADANPICEHVPFNKGIGSTGRTLYINPKLINGSYNEHTSSLRTNQLGVNYRSLIGFRSPMSKHTLF